MFACRKVCGLIAASLYEPLSESEQRLLDAHLAQCEACRKEAESLRALVQTITVPAIDFHGDLLPAVRAGVTPRTTPFVRPAYRWAMSLAALLLVATAVGIGVRLIPAHPAQDPVVTMASPMEKALVQARQLAKSDFSGARKALERGLSAYPSDPRAGEAQMMLADLEFNHGQRYKEAYAAYEKLRLNYNAVFAGNPDCVFRFNVLDEARADDYAPLYALDAAKSRSTDGMKSLETVVARYSGSLVASLAVDAMVTALGQPDGGDMALRAAALETLRNRCTDPVAIAQINLALGNVYWEKLHDPEKARPCYSVVAEGPHPPLAQLARLALSRMDADKAAH